MRKPSMLENIPTYLLTGPLGAGKTSVVRHWLRQRPPSEQWAVLVNEFGDVGLDAALLGPEKDGIAITEVAGGCVCCVNGAPFTIALSRLIRTVRPDRLLIELSGLSHPAPLLRQLREKPWAGVLTLNPLVVVVDGMALLERGALPEAVQVALQQRCTIIINKADLVSPAQRPTVEAALGSSGVWVTHGQLDWQALATTNQPEMNVSPVYASRASRPFTLAAEQTSSTSDWSIGWKLPPDRILDIDRIEELLRRWAWKRAKMIVHSPIGWRSANLLPGQPILWRESEWRGDNRLELIFDRPQSTPELEQAWAACEISTSGPGALVGLPPFA